MKVLLKILLVCAIVCVLGVLAIIALHGVALAGIYTYSRMKSGPSPAMNANPAPAFKMSPAPTDTHVVKRGETLSIIAARCQATVEELAALNGLQNINQISEGQSLRIPKKS